MDHQRITPFLWFDTQAREAAELYAATFPDAAIRDSNTLDNTPSGNVEVLTVEVAGYRLRLMSAGPVFSFTPAISLAVSCSTRDEVDRIWASLSDGGTALMDLGEYPFSEHYGWIQDRFGVSWQLSTSDEQPAQRVAPALLFAGDQYGRAEEAIQHYCRTFADSHVGEVWRYGSGEEPDREGNVKWASFWLDGEQFTAMESAMAHDFTFSGAMSLEVSCDSQDEIDAYWSSLSADPAAEQCGWLKDPYGVSWQIVPSVLPRMLADADQARVARVTEAFLPMKKLVIADLERAYAGA